MNTEKHMEGEKVKENIVSPGVATRWVALAALCSAATLLVAGAFDAALPAPLDRSAPPDRFIAQNAYEHLVNLTSIGPRVAGSYENEVAAVKVLLEAARGVQAAASPHNHVEVDVFSASGAFALTFIDGMTNMYRDVQSVALRGRARGRARGPRSAPPRRAAAQLPLRHRARQPRYRTTHGTNITLHIRHDTTQNTAKLHNTTHRDTTHKIRIRHNTTHPDIT
ncbi:unnamed protein product [Colias eurytheme]|nr:unnamed protein product [Colias eurytheme]